MTGTKIWSGRQPAGKSIASAGYAEARRRLERVREIPSIPAIPRDQQPIDVLRRRPDIVAAERRLAASNERIGAAISDYYPKISLSGALGFDSLSDRHVFTSGAFQAEGEALCAGVFDFGKVDAEVAQARGANAEAFRRLPPGGPPRC